MVISQPPGNNFILLSCFTNAASIALECFQRHLMFYTCNYNRVTHRNGAIKHIYTNQIHGGIISRLFLFILSLHALALHLAVKYYFKSFCMKIWARWSLSIHLSVGFPPECQSRTALCYATNTIKWKTFLIFDINHQKHKGGWPDWNDKNDNANYAPRITWKVLPMAQVAIFKEILTGKKRFVTVNCFILWTKTSQRLTLYLLSSHR